jgi:glycogen(starch) synthase
MIGENGMRLLYWTELFWPYIGGVEVLSAKLLRELQGRGYEIAVVTAHADMDLPDFEIRDGVPIHRFPFREVLEARDPLGVLRMRKAIKQLRAEFRPTITHVNFAGPSGYFHMASAPRDAEPWILAIRSPLPREYSDDSLITRLLRGADWVTANSGAVLADAHQTAPDIVGRSSVVYNGLDTPALDPAPLPFDPPRLLCLGRLKHDKGFDTALRAFARVRDAFPEAQLTVAGDGPERAALEELARTLGVEDAVEFVGWVSPEDVPAEVNRASAVIIPSRWEEPFCLVAVEAALMRRPVVATRVGGLVEVVAHQESGLTVPKEDPAAMAAAVQRLLRRPELARALGEQGRLRATDRFSLDRYVAEYDAMYRRLIRRAA